MQGLGNGLVKSLALDGSNLELESTGLAGAVTTGKGAGAPGTATVDLGQAGQLGKGLGVAERDIDDAVVGESRHGGDARRLLAAAVATGGDEEASILGEEATRSPDSACLVPKGLWCEIGRVAVVSQRTSTKAEDEPPFTRPFNFKKIAARTFH